MSLSGSAGNPDGIGSRIAVKYHSRRTETRELYSGSGYLSQSVSSTFFGIPTDDLPEQISVRWPDGKMTRSLWKVGAGPQITLKAE